MILDDPRIASNEQPHFVIGHMNPAPKSTDPKSPYCAAPDNFSDAIDRSRFMRTSVHIPGKSFILQVSNAATPNQAADSTDWVDLAETTTGYISTDALARFFRVKASDGETLPKGTRIYMVSIFPRY